MLSDVQDNTDTVDQAGLYVLLDRLDHLSDMAVNKGVSPLEVLKNPCQYRGKVLSFKTLIHPEVSPLQLSRDGFASESNRYFYVTGQIPFGKNQRMPAIVILPFQPDLKDTVDPKVVRGYFYMVLRAPTRKGWNQTGPEVLDYLVFAADRLESWQGETDGTDGFGTRRRWAGILAGLCAVVVLWFLVRRLSMTPVTVRKTISLQKREMPVLNINRDFQGPVIQVALGDRSYPIYVGDGILQQFERMYRFHCGRRRAAVITDETVGGLYGEVLTKSLQQAGVDSSCSAVPPGESSKRMPVCENLYERLFDFSLERSDRVIALGGGVVGDLAGFVAATFKRGVPFVQIPTTLLAMVDSSIGGKTGINHPRGKNMIGAFHQPEFVYIDTAVLKTLPRRELGCGLAESVKHAVIRDGEFFRWLEEHAADILDLKPDCLMKLVEWNCRIKAAVVSADERENGLRGILNLGHTIGHTLETVLPERDYHHGEAVSLGMVAACRLAVGRQMLSDQDSRRIQTLLDRFGLPTRAEQAFPVELLLAAMRHDKKVTQGKIRFVLPTRIGDCAFDDSLSEELVQEAIRSLQP